MEVGLLWYDSDPRRGLADKVGRAAQRYREKYGCWPNTCFVHPQAVGDGAQPELGAAHQWGNGKARIVIVSAPNMLLHHFWLGVSHLEAVEGMELALN